jgi:formiminoglutamase
MKIDFAFIDGIRINTFLRPREGEVKIGESITFAQESIDLSLENFQGDYVLIGVEEDIGPRANHGQGGAIFAFKSFLNRFLNMQVNRFIDVDKIMILGRVKAETMESGYAKRRENVAELDAFLIDILQKVYHYNKIPVLVGGGHNNAYPLIAAYAKSKQSLKDKGVNLSAGYDAIISALRLDDLLGSHAVAMGGFHGPLTMTTIPRNDNGGVKNAKLCIIKL